MKRYFFIAAAFFLFSFLLVLQFPGPRVSSALAAGNRADWKTEFNDVCSRTGQSMALSDVQLNSLIQRCDFLKKRIGKETDESAKKIYLRRLEKCRGMYSFTLQSRQNSGK